MFKFDWQWPGAFVFVVVFACLTFLIYTGKIPATYMVGLFTWLVPSPIQGGPVKGPQGPPGVAGPPGPPGPPSGTQG